MGNYGKLSLYKYLENQEGNPFQVEGKNPPGINYIKKSPLEYTIEVKEATSDYKLIFKSLFNKRWRARIDMFELVNHEIVYDYANSWDVDKKGSYSIDVIFKVWPWD